MFRSIKIALFCLFASTVLIFHSDDSSAQSWRLATGYLTLLDEVGPGLENGAGIEVSMVEAPISSGAYRPDFANADFLDRPVIFVDASGTNTGTSGHADTVAESFFGSSVSVGQGVTNVTLYEADDWINNVTGLDSGGNPLPQPYQVQNHSYIGNGAPASAVLSLLRRADYMASQNDMVVVVGTNNQGVTPQFMVPGYNLLSVGRTDGTHAVGSTQFYGVGRIKPEIVSSNGATSFSTATVSGTAALLREAAAGTSADHAEVIRALILAGATKTEFGNWNQLPSRPIDIRFGAGELNIYNSYMILQAGETDGDMDVPTTASSGQGWDFGSVEPFQSLNYLFELDEPADHVSVALTWDITIEDLNGSPTVFLPSSSLANLDLTLVGPNGVSESISTNHNLEHVYLRNAPAGQYFVIVEGDNLTSQTIDFGLAWRSAIENSAPVQSFSVVQGDQIGALKALGASDDNYVSIRPTGGDNQVEVEFTSSSPVNWINALSLDLEVSANTPNLLRTVEVFNFTTGAYETIEDSTENLGDNMSGVAVTDEATGPGFLMFTNEPVSSRFPSANSGNSESIVAVRFVSGVWQYNDNTNWLVFEPVDSDRLLATLDFTADTVTPLKGVFFELAGIDAGFVTSDLDFFANQFAGVPNGGEFEVTGTYFITQSESIGDAQVSSSFFGETYSSASPVTSEIRARVTWKAIGPVLMYPWTIRIDKAGFTVSK